MNNCVSVAAHFLAPTGSFPNHPRWPLLVYSSVVTIEGSDPAAAFESLFDRNRWPAAWRNGVHPFHHFHSTAHEVLGVYAGEVTAQFGGDHGIVIFCRTLVRPRKKLRVSICRNVTQCMVSTDPYSDTGRNFDEDPRLPDSTHLRSICLSAAPWRSAKSMSTMDCGRCARGFHCS